MRIGINVSVLKKGENISGIGYYTYRIIKDLIELDEKNEYFLFSNCELSVNFPLKKMSILYCYLLKVGYCGQDIFLE